MSISVASVNADIQTLIPEAKNDLGECVSVEVFISLALFSLFYIIFLMCIFSF